MSNFVIFEDQENFQEKTAATIGDARKDRVKLAPLAVKVLNKKNAAENQVRNILFAASSRVYLGFCFLLATFSPDRKIAQTRRIAARKCRCRFHTEKRICHQRCAAAECQTRDPESRRGGIFHYRRFQLDL